MVFHRLRGDGQRAEWAISGPREVLLPFQRGAWRGRDLVGGVGENGSDARTHERLHDEARGVQGH